MNNKNHSIDKCYQDLANAIVVQAVDDYRRLREGKRVEIDRKHKVTIEKLEEFFLSDWFYTLTNVDGQTILNRVRSEYQNECKTTTTNTLSH